MREGRRADVTGGKLKGRWELVFSSVPHGIFRSSPFFEAIYDSRNQIVAARPQVNHDRSKAELFFKLHELQTMSWGASKIGRVAQTIDPDNGMLYSEFDTQHLLVDRHPDHRLLETPADLRRLRRHRFQNEHQMRTR